ncbi:MAG: hypothetical protein PHE56_06780 [Bacteroidales bacterium]|nr:hypothetical protein [Bacteroidales bacterium]
MKDTKKKLKKPLTVKNLIDKKYKLLSWEGEWHEAFANPEMAGTWFIWGKSGNGKTNFVLQIIKELAKSEKVLLNSLEESSALSMQNSFKRNAMLDVKKNVLLVSDGYDGIIERLHRRNSPNIVVIDSFQYLQINYQQYIVLKETFPKKLFIFVSHADGSAPAGRPAKSVMFDASLKIYVEGYRAFSKGRYIGTKGYYNVWHEGAVQYWGN